MVRTDNPLRDQGFYLLSVLEADPIARKAMADEPELRRIGEASSAARNKALKDCKASAACMLDALRLAPEDVAGAEAVLSRLSGQGGPLARLVANELRPSGFFQKYADLDDAALMARAWRETAADINRLYDVYGAGAPPRYPEIDSMIWSPDSDTFRAGLRGSIDVTHDGKTDRPFFAIWSDVGLDLLLLNQRDDAVRYQPLDKGENRAALARAKGLKWTTYRYSAIIVPGAGTTDPERGLSGLGELRVRLAARRYQQGLAPFIIVSGGNVHPSRTPYNEAIEMKRDLMQRYQVPESAILVDTQARHTTTNLRNAARILFWAGASLEAPALVTTSREQSGYIESDLFARRCVSELGYLPHKLASRPGPFDLVVSFNLVSLHRDPSDPLDP